jgi:hypothetical protein
MYATGDAPSPIMPSAKGLKQISDTGALEKIIDEIIAANPKQVEQYKGGKTTVIGFFVGQVMKQSRGQANPRRGQPGCLGCYPARRGRLEGRGGGGAGTAVERRQSKVRQPGDRVDAAP